MSDLFRVGSLVEISFITEIESYIPSDLAGPNFGKNELFRVQSHVL
jgi:hypothetical protein